jgi:hypothetical protein
VPELLHRVLALAAEPGGGLVTAPVRAYCPLGGPAPCVDDLCHGSDHTICGLEYGFDFCAHGFLPDSCSECRDEEFGTWEDEGRTFDDELPGSEHYVIEVKP